MFLCLGKVLCVKLLKVKGFYASIVKRRIYKQVHFVLMIFLHTPKNLTIDYLPPNSLFFIELFHSIRIVVMTSDWQDFVLHPARLSLSETQPGDTMNHISISFFGDYRPIVLQGDCLKTLSKRAVQSIADTQDAAKLTEWIRDCIKTAKPDTCSRAERSDSSLSVSVNKYSHDNFLNDITRDLPLYPNAKYQDVA